MLLTALVVAASLTCCAKETEHESSADTEPPAESSLSVEQPTENSLYIEQLMQAGFPQDYAVQLEQLHQQHPAWTFEPVRITDANPTYTWKYVIDQEMYPRRNLVTTSTWAPAGSNPYYAPYYDATNQELYDSGWRQASREAVEYMMDPRNFLNEADIFMFETLEYNPEIHTEAAVESALRGSFLAASEGTPDGVDTYAEILYKLGKKYNCNPVYLANRILMEQGTAGASPLVNGTLGTTLWGYYSDPQATTDSGKIIWGGQYDVMAFSQKELLALDGLYNFFNMEAAGTGVFAIYMNASREAQREGWKTKTAAVFGGVRKVHERYIANYQHTPYFQKFNVHPGSSNNFWGQYMQDISGALIGGRRGYNDYLDTGNLEVAHHFVIPVYEGMPQQPCPDPANGQSYYSPTVIPRGHESHLMQQKPASRRRQVFC